MSMLGQKVKAIKAAFSSKQAFLAAIETKESAQGRLANRNPWTNEDLGISPKKDWTWGWWDYAAFWWSYGFSTGVWTAGSSLVSLGMTSWQAIICIFVSHLLGAIGMAMHSRSSATYHFGFPIASRIPWGLRGGYFPVFVRVLVGTIWVGVQLVQGGYFVAVLFSAVFGEGFANMKNTSRIDNHPPSLERAYSEGSIALHYQKSVVLPPIVIGLFVFCMLQARDSGEAAGTFSQTGTLKGSALAWAMLGGINSVMGKTSTSIVNQPDLARYARTQTAPTWSQLIALPIGNTLCATLGIFGTSAIRAGWGEAIWNPWDLCSAILDRYGSGHAGARAGVAVVALGFVFSILGSNLGANVIPWGADTAVLFPRYINIRRGMYISYVLGVAVCPWRILKSASSFLQFLGGYSIFLGPFVGIFLTDYLVCRRGNMYVADLYTPGGRYWYRHGAHWRAAVAYVVAVVLPIPGFAQTFGEPVPLAWLRIYQVGWLLTCTLSSVVYWLLCFVGDVAVDEKQMAFEAIAWEQLEPYIEPETERIQGREPPVVEAVGVINEPKA